MVPIIYIFQFDGKEAILLLDDIVSVLTEEEKKEHKKLIELCREDEKIIGMADECLDISEEELYEAGRRLSQRVVELEDIFQDKTERIQALLESMSQKSPDDFQEGQILLADWLRQQVASRNAFLRKLMESFDWTRVGRA